MLFFVGPSPSLPTRERGLKDTNSIPYIFNVVVAPYAGAWIERFLHFRHVHLFIVAPYAGAWIERLPIPYGRRKAPVAPYAGAWIERLLQRQKDMKGYVAPYAGAWIERISLALPNLISRSLPTRERGLKVYWLEY